MLYRAHCYSVLFLFRFNFIRVSWFEWLFQLTVTVEDVLASRVNGVNVLVVYPIS